MQIISNYGNNPAGRTVISLMCAAMLPTLMSIYQLQNNEFQ